MEEEIQNNNKEEIKNEIETLDTSTPQTKTKTETETEEQVKDQNQLDNIDDFLDSLDNKNRVQSEDREIENLNESLNSETVNTTKILAQQQQEEDEIVDVLYNTLRQLSNTTAMRTPRQRKVSKSIVSSSAVVIKSRESSIDPISNHYRTLDFVLSPPFYTNGEMRINEPVYDGSRNKSLKRIKIPTIGTSCENFDKSDTISIDIDPKSTLLPLMCKLMIIVEGAIYERGKCILVRDAGIQVNFNDNENVNKNENNLKIKTKQDVSY
jgi:hypothetical protein